MDKLAAGEMTLMNPRPFRQAVACYEVLLPPHCLASGRAAVKTGMKRLRSEQSNTTLCSYYHLLSSASQQNIPAISYALHSQVGKELTDMF